MPLGRTMTKVKHLILSPVDYTTCSTDNNCVSILINYGRNSTNANGSLIDRERMILSERYTSQKQFTALKSKETFYSVLKFKTGAVIVVGLKETDLTELCVVKAVAAISDTLEYPIWIDSVSIVNRVSTFNRFNLNFNAIRSFFRRHRLAHNYIPGTFPGMFFKIKVPKDTSRGTEYLGAYYMQAALECRAAKTQDERNAIVEKWFHVKRALIFKVGKHTILGKSARDDVSIEARLMFGFFHYFMHRTIKMSKSEILRIREKYSIPPLDWFVSAGLFFHDDVYEPPSLEDLRKSLKGDTNRNSIDPILYGSDTGDNIDAIMANNILPDTRIVMRQVDILCCQKITARYNPRAITAAALEAGAFDAPDDDWWVKRKKRTPIPPHLDTPLCSSTIRASIGNNGGWLRSKHGSFYDKIHNLVLQELKEGLILDGYLDEKEIGPPSFSASVHANSVHGSRNANAANIRHKNRVRIARLATHMEVFKFINKEITTGNAHHLAALLGTDVYSLVNMINNLPRSPGHYTALLKEHGGEYDITPGVAFFNKVLRRDSGGYPPPAGTDRDDAQEEAVRKKRVTSDFIKNITAYEDDGVEKIGLNINMASILEMLNKDDTFSPSECPAANYRTALHANSQTRSILIRLMISILSNAEGMTEEDEELARAAVEASNNNNKVSSKRRASDDEELLSMTELAEKARLSIKCDNCSCGREPKRKR